MKVEISNYGESYASIIREVTQEQYEFLLSIAEELGAKDDPYAPNLEIEQIKEHE